MSRKDEFVRQLSSKFSMSGKHWLCGLEPGFGNRSPAEWAQEFPRNLQDLAPDIAEISTSVLRRYPYGRAQIRVCAAYLGVPEKSSMDEALRFLEAARFTVTHFNLYPLPFWKFADNHWDEMGASELTGISSKQEYRALCEQHLHSDFRRNLQESPPDWILCFGTSHRKFFTSAFAPPEDIREEQRVTLCGGNKAFTVTQISLNSVHTQIIVAPHPSSPTGLNSSAKRFALGKFMREVLPQ